MTASVAGQALARNATPPEQGATLKDQDPRLKTGPESPVERPNSALKRNAKSLRLKIRAARKSP